MIIQTLLGGEKIIDIARVSEIPHFTANPDLLFKKVISTHCFTIMKSDI